MSLSEEYERQEYFRRMAASQQASKFQQMLAGRDTVWDRARCFPSSAECAALVEEAKEEAKEEQQKPNLLLLLTEEV